MLHSSIEGQSWGGSISAIPTFSKHLLPHKSGTWLLKWSVRSYFIAIVVFVGVSDHHFNSFKSCRFAIWFIRIYSCDGRMERVWNWKLWASREGDAVWQALRPATPYVPAKDLEGPLLFHPYESMKHLYLKWFTF